MIIPTSYPPQPQPLYSAVANVRHEVAYIFGQLCSPHSVPSLLHVLRDQQEDDMVRHEAAEALGGIASDAPEPSDGGEKGEDVLAILREWAVKMDAPVVVRESCQVAIDMWEVSTFVLLLIPYNLGYVTGLSPIRKRFGEWTRVIGQKGMVCLADADTQYENSTDQFNPLDKLEAKSNVTGMERSAQAAVAAGM